MNEYTPNPEKLWAIIEKITSGVGFTRETLRELAKEMTGIEPKPPTPQLTELRNGAVYGDGALAYVVLKDSDGGRLIRLTNFQTVASYPQHYQLLEWMNGRGMKLLTYNLREWHRGEILK